jgi:hypothetical protein
VPGQVAGRIFGRAIASIALSQSSKHLLLRLLLWAAQLNRRQDEAQPKKASVPNPNHQICRESSARTKPTHNGSTRGADVQHATRAGSSTTILILLTQTELSHRTLVDTSYSTYGKGDTGIFSPWQCLCIITVSCF